jgi:Raf kinase inhibitor-like YbhB/YbcL family protein
MLEKLPPAIGRALRRVRPGMNRIAANQENLGGSNEALVLESPAFAKDTNLPVRFTADGEGVSPPLRWSQLPEGTVSVALLVEDADSPTPAPLVHAIVVNLTRAGELAEGAMVDRDGGPLIGKNSFMKAGWLPPDPPRGHGPHRYAFQILALDNVPQFDWPPGREHLLRAIRPHVIGRGSLVGIYQRK